MLVQNVSLICVLYLTSGIELNVPVSSTPQAHTSQQVPGTSQQIVVPEIDVEAFGKNCHFKCLQS